MNGSTEASDKLSGKRIAVLAADGFEQAELEAAVAALKAAGAAVAIVALRAGRIRGMNVQQPANLLRVDLTIGDAVEIDYDGLLLPGGYIGPDLLRQSSAAREFVRAFDAIGKPIACMSHAALVLVSSGLAKGRCLTCWPGIRDDLVNAGATWLNRDVVRDGAYLSSRSPEDATAFVRALPPFFAGELQTVDADAAAAGSDPPPQAASELPGQSLRWLAAPSLGAMLSLAILGVGVVAANSSRRKRGDQDALPDGAPAQEPEA